LAMFMRFPLFACLVFASHGQQVQMNGQSGPISTNQQQSLAEDARAHLAKLLIAANPAYTFNPSGPSMLPSLSKSGALEAPEVSLRRVAAMPHLQDAAAAESTEVESTEEKEPKPKLTSVFLTNISVYPIAEKYMSTLLGEEYQKDSLFLYQVKGGYFKRTGIATFKSEAAGRKAIKELKGKKIGGVRLALEAAQRFPTNMSELPEGHFRVYMAGLPLETAVREELTELFESCGKIGKITLSKVRGQPGTIKSWGFIGFEDAKSADLAIEKFNGTDLYDRKLFVAPALQELPEPEELPEENKTEAPKADEEAEEPKAEEKKVEEAESE